MILDVVFSFDCVKETSTSAEEHLQVEEQHLLTRAAGSSLLEEASASLLDFLSDLILFLFKLCSRFRQTQAPL